MSFHHQHQSSRSSSRTVSSLVSLLTILIVLSSSCVISSSATTTASTTTECQNSDESSSPASCRNKNKGDDDDEEKISEILKHLLPGETFPEEVIASLIDEEPYVSKTNDKCHDVYQKTCSAWAKDQCVNTAFIRICKKSCGQCIDLDFDMGIEQTINGNTAENSLTLPHLHQQNSYIRSLLSSTNPPPSSCRNDFELCIFWTARGECENNPTFMTTSCTLACRRCDTTTTTDPIKPPPPHPPSYSWSHLLSSNSSITANGNIYPPPPTESHNSCLLLLSHTLVLRHCPNLNTFGPNDSHDESHPSTSRDNTVVVHAKTDERFRGAFSAPGTERRRVWLLTTPYENRPPVDILKEYDTLEERVVQEVTVPISSDGHDAIRIDNHIFIVDTRGGSILEIALPASAPPYTESSMAAGATRPTRAGVADVIKRHTGFSRADHINNLAVHDDVLLVSAHGGRNAKTRLSALARNEGGGELNKARGFDVLTNTGTWCHNIAFWTDPASGETKLLTLDSKEGSLVAITLAGDAARYKSREVVWTPDVTHPVLTPPSTIPSNYQGTTVFAKGMAVQGNTAFIAVSFARDPKLRRVIPYSLLVAVDLTTRKELFARTIRSRGLISQIVSESYLGYQLRLPKANVVSHDEGGSCVDKEGWTDGVLTCGDFVTIAECQRSGMIDGGMGYAKDNCCTCGGGSNEGVLQNKHQRDHQNEYSTIAHALGDPSIFNNNPNRITHTVTFPQPTGPDDNNCRNDDGSAKMLPLEYKNPHRTPSFHSVATHLDHTVKPICHLSIPRLQSQILSLGASIFDPKVLRETNASTLGRAKLKNSLKPGVELLFLIFSSNNNKHVYHFPLLDDFFPMIREEVLDPLGIDPAYIHRMQFANMTVGSAIHPHADTGPWAQDNHRVHVPITTHPLIFFNIIFSGRGKRDDSQDVLRIRSRVGEAFEINNIMRHHVSNMGGNRVHLIIDYGDSKPERVTKLRKGDVCDTKARPDQAWVCKNGGVVEE